MRIFLLLVIMWGLLIPQSFAESTTIKNPLASSAPVFDVKAANQKFDRINLKLSTQGLDQTTLKDSVKALKALLNNSDECIRLNEKKIANIDGQIQEASQATEKIDQEVTGSKSAADLVYLTNERKKLAEQLSQCRLFTIRAKEALEVYESTLSKIKKQLILERGEPFWSNLEAIATSHDEVANIPLTVFNVPQQILYPKSIYAIFIASFLFASLIYYKFLHSKKINRYIKLNKVYLPSFVLLLLALASVSTTGYLAFIYCHLHTVSDLLLWLSSAISVYLVGLFGALIIFNIKKVKAFFRWYSLDSDYFKYLTVFIFSFYALSKIGNVLANQLNLNALIWKVEQSIFLYIELILALFFVFYFCYKHKKISFIKKHKSLIKVLALVMFASFAILNLLGYNSLSFHLTFSGVVTFAIIFSTLLAVQAIGKMYKLCLLDGPIRDKLTKFFGYKHGQTLTEILILKSTLQLVITLCSLYLISKSWGYTSNYLDSTFKYIIYGIKFENFTFNPTRVIFGLIVFCVLYLIFRSISTAISRHEQFDGEEETQVAIASIFIYIGFTVAIVSALLISGFDFTGLAIVAGALSVGIGLGLQSIVNNFVSGIILLIEKPIKPGDRINVDGVEGYVKKIRVRSTQILTLAREDIIIPNSDLITHRVTNYMYSDKYLTIYCEMGISYDSDIELARNLLIDIASKHPDIIKTVKNNKPRVFLRAFNENSLLCQLWFLIRDGNRKVAVRSEIYFEICKVFREHNISIAFPQRDLHIKVKDIETIKDLK